MGGGREGGGSGKERRGEGEKAGEALPCSLDKDINILWVLCMLV